LAYVVNNEQTEQSDSLAIPIHTYLPHLYINYAYCYRPSCAPMPDCRYCFYLLAQKWVFRPTGATLIAPINVKFGTEPLPRTKFHVYQGINVGIQPPKLSKFRILAIYLCLGGDSCNRPIFTKFSAFVRVYRYLSSF